MKIHFEEFMIDCREFYGSYDGVSTSSELGIKTMISIMYGYPKNIIIDYENRTIEIN